METLDEPGSMKFEPGDQLAGLPDEVKDSPIGPSMGIAAIALNMAMKYHDISTIHDGQLYQQYKLEGRNMVTLHLDMVFATAMQIEEHLVRANRRVAKLFVLAALEGVEDAETEDQPANGDDESPATTSE